MTQWTSRFGKRSTADEVVADRDLSEKTVLVTGANTGIGFETARALASRGAHTVLGCRDMSKGEDAARRVREQHPQASVEVRALDLGEMASVRRFADSFPADTLDILVCNAAVYGGGYQETADGFERTLGVCHIGHFLLTLLFLDRLRASGAGRVVMISSESHRHPGKLNFDQLPPPQSNMAAYGQAKLCNALFAYELQRRYGDQGITTYVVHPGALVPTEFGRHSSVARVMIWLARPFSKSVVQAAATSVLCATDPELGSLGGRYFADCQLKESSPESRSPEVAARLWELSEEWVGVKPPT